MQFLKQNETKSPQQSEELTFEPKKPTADLRDWPLHCSNCACLLRENETLFSGVENNEWLHPSGPVMCSTCLQSFLSSVSIPHPSSAEGTASLEGCRGCYLTSPKSTPCPEFSWQLFSSACLSVVDSSFSAALILKVSLKMSASL